MGPYNIYVQCLCIACLGQNDWIFECLHCTIKLLAISKISKF